MLRTVAAHFIGSSGSRALRTYRRAMKLHGKGFTRLARFYFANLERTYGLFIKPDAEIGEGLRFPHPTGIVIGEGVKIGKNVVIYQQVTLGGARRGDWQAGAYPIIGDGTVIFAGAKIIGPIRVGRNCVIGANAVVTKDVPDDHTAVGIPARMHPNKT